MAQRQKNREKLIKVACNLFATRGFRGTSIRDIARAMDMNVSNIYHHFGNKEGLLLAILKHASTRIIEKLLHISEKDIDPLERFRLLLNTHLSISLQYLDEAKIFSLDEEHLTSEGYEINREIQREVLSLYIKQLEILEELGYIRDRNLNVMAFNILAVINWHLRWFKPNGPLHSEEIAAEIITFILHGALTHPGETPNGG